MRKRDERRLQENEVIFKQVNKDMDDFLNDIGVRHQVSVPFFCECSDLNCRVRIELTPAEYKKIHKNKQYFVVVNGHEIPEIEETFEHNDTYAVVRKLDVVPNADDVQHRLKEL